MASIWAEEGTVQYLFLLALLTVTPKKLLGGLAALVGIALCLLLLQFGGTRDFYGWLIILILPIISCGFVAFAALTGDRDRALAKTKTPDQLADHLARVTRNHVRHLERQQS